MTMSDPKILDDGPPLELLIKLCKMTESDNDNVALIAARKINAHLKKLGADWDSLLRGKVKIIADPFASTPSPTVDSMLNRSSPFNPPPAPRRPPPPSQPYTPAPPPPAYNPPPPRAPRSTVRPAPGSSAFSGDTKTGLEIVNKFKGTCTKCKNTVEAGDGKAIQWKRPDGSTYFLCEHSGPCPTTRRSRPTNTVDQFQV